MGRKALQIIWLQAGSCGGCTMSALGAEERGVVAALKPFGLDLLWHPAISEECGPEAVDILERAASGDLAFDILCVEGSVILGPNNTGRFQMMSGTGKPMYDWIHRLANRATYVVAVGSCAAFGGMPTGGRNPSGSTGLQFSPDGRGPGFLKPDFRAKSGLPVINIAGCAPHPGWITELLAALALGGVAGDDLDYLQRPKFYADHLAHHGCARNEFYEYKASAVDLSDRGCLMEHLGCKATQAVGDCNLRTWNGATGACSNAGFTCINCTAPGFENPGHAFQETPKIGGIPVGLPTDMPKAWFIALAALSKSATPERVRENARSDHVKISPKHGEGQDK